MLRSLAFTLLILVSLVSLAQADETTSSTPAVEAIDFETREVFRAQGKPAYTSWVSIFPGHKGEWYLSFEQVSKPKKPLPLGSLDHWYRMSLPNGYDKSQYLMEVVLLRSDDQCKSWKEMSRQPVRFQHSAGSFGQVRTKDGRFLRSMWNCYRLDDPIQSGQFIYESKDEGRTWKQQPAILDDRFCAYPHRMKQLRDGTIVLALPYGMMWGPAKVKPIRHSKPASELEDFGMSLLISRDEGRHWEGPIPVFPQMTISETDFVELPSGDLMLFVNSIFARPDSTVTQPGRQRIYRIKDRFVPGSFEVCVDQYIPETVTMTKDGILVGSMRNGSYYWSDDEGKTWSRLAGTPGCGYQPEIDQLEDGRVICAWHRGADDRLATADQFVGIDLFRLKVNRPTTKTDLKVERQYDAKSGKFLDEYVATLTANGKPLGEKPLVLWYVLPETPGYEPFNRGPLMLRMKQGGTKLEATTDRKGQAQFSIPAPGGYQMAVLFNADRKDLDYLPSTTAICLFYESSGNGAPASTLKR